MTGADLQTRKLWVLGVGVVGGLVIGSWGVQHLFGERLEEDERKQLIYGGIIAMLIGGAYLLDLDKRWWDLETQSNWLEGQITGAMK